MFTIPGATAPERRTRNGRLAVLAPLAGGWTVGVAYVAPNGDEIPARWFRGYTTCGATYKTYKNAARAAERFLGEQAMKIVIVNDVTAWVRDHVDPELGGDDIAAITRAILAMDHPPYGTDWQEFFDSLPDTLVNLIEENQAMKTVKVRVLHESSIPGTRWVLPVGWVPLNQVPGGVLRDGSWWDDEEEVAGLVLVGDKFFDGEIAEVPPDMLRVSTCGECRILGNVVTTA